MAMRNQNQTKILGLMRGLKRTLQKKDKPKPPPGYRLCKTLPTYSAVDKKGHILLWIPAGYDLENICWVEGFWKSTSFNEKLSHEQISRFRKWLLEENDS